MGLIDLFRGELLEIIEWIDDSRDTLAWRFPDEDKAIKNGAQLIVRESQVAQLVMTGQFADLFWPGKHTLSTPNLPVLARLQGWKYGFVSPFKVDIYYVIDPTVHRQQVGHIEPRDDARPGLWRRAAAGLRNL